MRISDWSSDVCSSDLPVAEEALVDPDVETLAGLRIEVGVAEAGIEALEQRRRDEAGAVAGPQLGPGRAEQVGAGGPPGELRPEILVVVDAADRKSTRLKSSP